MFITSGVPRRLKTDYSKVLWTPQSWSQINILADIFLKMNEYIMVHKQYNKNENIENMVLTHPPPYKKRNNYLKILYTLAYYARLFFL